MSFDWVKHVERVQKPKLQTALPFILYERHSEFPRPSLYTPTSLSVCLPIYMSIYLSICCPSVCLSLWSTCLFCLAAVHPSLYLVYLPVYVILSAVHPSMWSICPPIYLSVCLSICCPSVCLSIWSTCLPIRLSILSSCCPSVHVPGLSICLCLSIFCPSVRLFGLSVRLPVHVYTLSYSISSVCSKNHAVTIICNNAVMCNI
jgi:hypothetical protein